MKRTVKLVGIAKLKIEADMTWPNHLINLNIYYLRRGLLCLYTDKSAVSASAGTSRSNSYNKHFFGA